jgi:hypothetical protein
MAAAGGRGEGPSVILSGDHARAGNQRPRRRNLGWGQPSISWPRGQMLTPSTPPSFRPARLSMTERNTRVN